MKIDIIVIVSDALQCADYLVHTGQKLANTVKTYRRSIEIPDYKEGWCIRSIDSTTVQDEK